jgi:hypothetical protein
LRAVQHQPVSKRNSPSRLLLIPELGIVDRDIINPRDAIDIGDNVCR